MTTALGFWIVSASAATAWFVTPWVARAAHALGAIDLPDARKIHTGAVPRLGGAAVAAAIAVGIAVSIASEQLLQRLDDGTLIGLLGGALLVFAVGARDDVRRLGALPKLAVQIAAAVLAWHLGIRIEVVTVPWTGEVASLGAWSLPVTLLWIVLVTNAWNLIDGLDGLAATLGLIAAGVFTIILVVRQADHDLALVLPLVGALLGFLPFNWHPARIFLGDSGSYLIGFYLAAISILSGQKGVTSFAIFGPIAILGLPLMDTSLAVLRRLLRSEAGPLEARLRSVLTADREHLHHRALARGWSSSKAVAVLALLAAILGGAGLAMTFVRSPRVAGLAALIAVLLVLMLYSQRSAHSGSANHHREL